MTSWSLAYCDDREEGLCCISHFVRHYDLGHQSMRTQLDATLLRSYDQILIMSGWKLRASREHREVHS